MHDAILHVKKTLTCTLCTLTSIHEKKNIPHRKIVYTEMFQCIPHIPLCTLKHSFYSTTYICYNWIKPQVCNNVCMKWNESYGWIYFRSVYLFVFREREREKQTEWSRCFFFGLHQYRRQLFFLIKLVSWLIRVFIQNVWPNLWLNVLDLPIKIVWFIQFLQWLKWLAYIIISFFFSYEDCA